MKGLRALALAAAFACAWPAHAQPQGRPAQQGVQPRKAGNDRYEYRRERMDRGERYERHERRERFTREERDKLRQDLLDANREMKRGR